MPSTLDLSQTFRYAFGRIATRNGLLLVAAYVFVQLLSQATTQSLAARLTADRLPADAVGSLYPLAVDLPVAVSGGLTVVLFLCGTVLGVLTVRAFHRDLEAFPTADHTRRLARTTVVALVVSLIVFLAIVVGTFLFVFPGIFLAVSLVFAVLVVAVEDAGVIESLKRSWALASGNRIRLFAIGFVLVVASGIVGFVFSAIGAVAPLVGEVTGAVATGVIGIFGIGLVVGAYRQIAPATADAVDPTSTAL
ncbi:hypothetical protein [Haloplanus salilacus]|uniref:hypothetical protein n=1 Tax=Haloplanus salilacus TaxID=2949994 RepID=UPI0030CFAD74